MRPALRQRRAALLQVSRLQSLWIWTSPETAPDCVRQVWSDGACEDMGGELALDPKPLALLITWQSSGGVSATATKEQTCAPYMQLDAAQPHASVIHVLLEMDVE